MKLTDMSATLHPTEFKSLRESMGISQSKLSVDTGINRSYLSQFESGKRLLTDNELETLKEYFENLGGEMDENKIVTLNGQEIKYDIRQNDGFILPVNLDEELATDILNLLGNHTDVIMNLLSQQIPQEGFLADKNKVSELKLEQINSEVLETMATCYLLILRLRGDDSLIKLLTNEDDKLAAGPHIYNASKLINQEGVLLF